MWDIRPQEKRKGEKRGLQELLDVLRGEIEIRGLNSGMTKRRRYVDIGEIKRSIANNEGDLIPAVIRLGRPKEEEDRIAVAERYGEETSEEEEEGYGEFGVTGTPTEIANDIIILMHYGFLRWDCAVDMQIDTEEEPYKTTGVRFKSGHGELAVYIGCHLRRKSSSIATSGGRLCIEGRMTPERRLGRL